MITRGGLLKLERETCIPSFQQGWKYSSPLRQTAPETQGQHSVWPFAGSKPLMQGRNPCWKSILEMCRKRDSLHCCSGLCGAMKSRCGGSQRHSSWKWGGKDSNEVLDGSNHASKTSWLLAPWNLNGSLGLRMGSGDSAFPRLSLRHWDQFIMLIKHVARFPW